MPTIPTDLQLLHNEIQRLDTQNAQLGDRILKLEEHVILLRKNQISAEEWALKIQETVKNLIRLLSPGPGDG